METVFSKLSFNDTDEHLGYYCSLCNKVLQYKTARQLHSHLTTTTHLKRLGNDASLKQDKLQKKLNKWGLRFPSKNVNLNNINIFQF